MAFQLFGGRATWDYTGKSTALSSTTPGGGTTPSTGTNTPTSGTVSNVVWFDDPLPSGAQPGGDNGDGWNWVNTPTPFSGKVAHQSNIASGMHQMGRASCRSRWSPYH